MKKIINPWKGLEGYNCFGCASCNEAGLKVEFYEDGDEVVSIWKPVIANLLPRQIPMSC